MNGSTWFDRTNYYETLPSNRLDLALWLESDRMGFFLPAISQAKLDNQRDVVKNERRQSYENRPYGLAVETVLLETFPAGHPYRHPTIGYMEDLDAATSRTLRLLPRLVRAGQRRPRGGRRRRPTPRRWTGSRALVRGSLAGDAPRPPR